MNLKNNSVRRRQAKRAAKTARMGPPEQRSWREMQFNVAFREFVKARVAKIQGKAP